MKKIKEILNILLEKIKKIASNRKACISIGAVIAVLLIVLITVLAVPGNRAKRALVKGDKLFSVGNFEKASAQYLKATELKSNLLEAYKGLVLSDGEFDIEKARQDFAMSDSAYSALTAEELNENTSSIVELYLLAPGIFADDPESLMMYLERGYELSGNSPDLLPALTDACMGMTELLMDTDIDKAIEYDLRVRKTLESATGYEDRIISKLSECIYSSILADDYETAYALTDKYKGTYNLDADTIKQDIDSSKDLYDTKVTLLSEVYEIMENYYSIVEPLFGKDMFSDSYNVVEGMPWYDFSRMMELDGSELAEKLATSFTQSAYIYAPNFSADYEGFIAGLYPYGETYTTEEETTEIKYYFYFGQYKNGKRNGHGVSFAKASDRAYIGYEGEWKDDAPNGFGVTYQNLGLSEGKLSGDYCRATYGTYANGIQTGTINVKVVLAEAQDEIFMGSYEAENGVGKEVPIKTDDYEIIDEISEDQRLIAVVPGVSEGYNIYIKILQNKSELLSALGY